MFQEIKKKISAKTAANLLAIFAVVIVIVNIFLQNNFPETFLAKFANDYFGNIATELIGIWVTVLIIDRLNQTHNRESLKESLVSQMKSEHNILATDAVRRIRDEGWENELEGISLYYANLENAPLYDFNLKKAEFTYAKFKNANLNGAKLNGAVIAKSDFEGARFHRTSLKNVQVGSEIDAYILKGSEFVHANLAGATFRGIFNRIMTESYHPHLMVANRLEGSIMPTGKKYNGCYNLTGDLNLAVSRGHDASNPFAMAEFYEVSVDEYMQGQSWKEKYDDYLLQREAKAMEICKEKGWDWDEMDEKERGQFLDIWYKEP